MDAKKKKAKTQSFSQKTEQKASHWKIRTKILLPMFHFIVFWRLLDKTRFFCVLLCCVCNNYIILVPNEPKCTKKRFRLKSCSDFENQLIRVLSQNFKSISVF